MKADGYRRDARESGAMKTTIERIGGLLILVGAAVWVVWLVVRLAGGDPQVGDYLPFHLAGVIPGSLLARWHAIKRLIRRD